MSFVIDVRRLRLLHHLATHGTVAATARALHLTGPAVSQQLAALERDTGLPLLEKHGRVLRLTSAGRLLVDHAEVILGDLAAAEADLTALRAGGSGTVRIAAFPSAACALVPRVWKALAADDGNQVAMRLVEHEPEVGVEALRRRDVDIAIVHAYTLIPRDLPPGCEQYPLLDDPVLLALPPGLRAELGLGRGEPVNLARLARAKWLIPEQGTSCAELTVRACGAAGFVPDQVVSANDTSVLAALVAAGAGVALIPRMALPQGPLDLDLHPLTRPASRSVSALTGRGLARQPHIRRVLDLLADAAAALAPETFPV